MNVARVGYASKSDVDTNYRRSGKSIYERYERHGGYEGGYDSVRGYGGEQQRSYGRDGFIRIQNVNDNRNENEDKVASANEASSNNGNRNDASRIKRLYQMREEKRRRESMAGSPKPYNKSYKDEDTEDAKRF